MTQKTFLSLIILFTSFNLVSQEKTRKFKWGGSLTSRYMSTNNSGDLENFNAFVFYGDIGGSYKVNSWLTLSTQVNGLAVPNTDGITKIDVTTGSGPIYEGNLFNIRTMSGNSEFALPILSAQIELEGQFITIGRFLKNTPAVNAEPWPFPNALEGVWYENYKAENTSWQLGAIYRIAPRFSGNFETIGSSIGVGGIGVDVFGDPSGYRENVESDILIIGNYNKLFNEIFSIDIWDYYAEGITNTLLIEPKVQITENDLTFSALGMYQTKVGDGGNDNPSLAFRVDDLALYFGLRAEKRIGKNSFQLNFSRISDNGRFLLPREWGLEPFYTFQRRTRIEGFRDVTSLMFKWERIWSNNSGNYRLFSSLGKNKLPVVTDAPRNKYYTPSHYHWAWDFKYEPTQWMKGLSAEIYTAYRFLDATVDNDPDALINRADFYHFDFILNYSF